MIPLDTRERILSALMAHTRRFVSGAVLETLLGISQDDIAQHIAHLRTEGVGIEARAGTGYRLTEIPDRLSPALIRRELVTEIVAQEIHYFRKTDSTNSIAKELACSGAADGTLVIAEEQSSGRGRMERRWVSRSCSSILSSIIFYPPLKPSAVFRLTMMASIAVVTAIRRVCALPAVIKWPNDVYLNMKKVCGILTELAAEKDSTHYAVVGIGINVNGDLHEYPEIEGIATTLEKESGRRVSRIDLLNKLLAELDRLYQGLIKNGGDDLKRQWEQYSMVLGRQVTVVSGDEQVEGIARGIDSDGHLIVTDPHGNRREIVSGDVSLKL